MTPLRRFSTFLSLSALSVATLAGCEDGHQPLAPDLSPPLTTSEAPVKAPPRNPITVMTRNLYHGGDIGPVLQVGFSDLELLAETAAGVWAEVQANDFHERVGAIVDEIEAADPDIVGFQEMARFVTLALNMSTQQFEGTGMIDFQSIITAELAARGLDYAFVAAQDNTQVTVPVAGVNMGGQFVPTQLVQLTVRDGVLLRGSLVGDVITYQSNYDEYVPLGSDPFGNPIKLLRGWIRVDLDMDGTPYHFVNTHLEIQSFAAVQEKQTEELLTEVVAGLDGITIMNGDFNSGADSEPGSPAWTESYGQVLSAGFMDTWAMANHGASYLRPTCCQASDLRNTDSELETRVDFVFIRVPGPRGALNHLPGTLTVDQVGVDPYLKTEPNGLWPSDHAGLVANIWLAPGHSKPGF